jgi:rhamnosyltransferase
MKSNQLCAVVVSFHPDHNVLENLAALCAQVQHVVVVDNGSLPQELQPLRSASRHLGFELLENGENLGIATALNIGLRRAQALDAPFTLLFDQDSRITGGFIEAMLHCFQTSPRGRHLGILVPHYTDMRLGTPLPRTIVASSGLEVAMTSGSLLRTQTFAQHGLFVDDLFIDGVDHEYSLRLRRSGMFLEECPDATLLHSPGTPQEFRLGGKVLFKTPNYSPIRRYYQTRNNLWLFRHYFRSFPAYCTKLALASVKDFLKILLFESSKLKKLQYFLRGFIDGLNNRMGRFDPR